MTNINIKYYHESKILIPTNLICTFITNLERFLSLVQSNWTKNRGKNVKQINKNSFRKLEDWKMGDAKFKLEDILNKQKAPPQILDLANIKIETEEEFKNVIEKIPDYRIKPERVSLLFFAFIY